eukprot:7210070-Pyramimonas_sp.AAC.1
MAGAPDSRSGRASSSATQEQLDAIVKRHISSSDTISYTSKLDGPVDSKVIVRHSALITELRAASPAGGINKVPFKRALQNLASSKESERRLSQSKS